MTESKNERPTGSEKITFVSQGLFLLLVFGYFLSLGDYVLFFQEQQSLFVFSAESLGNDLSRPGGPLVYLAGFLTQFYAEKWLAALVVSVVLTLPAFLLFGLYKRTFKDRSFPWVLPLIPSLLLFAMQGSLYHGMEVNLGFLLVVLFYLVAAPSTAPWGKTSRRVFVLLLLPFFFYAAGAYVLIFTAVYLCHLLLSEEGRRRVLHTSLLLAAMAISFLAFWKVLFLQAFRDLLLSPLPSLENPAYTGALVLLLAYFILIPFLSRDSTPLFTIRMNQKLYALVPAVIVLAVSGWILLNQFDGHASRVVELERYVYAEEWERVIEVQENAPSRVQVAQFLYNTALSETDQLCDRLFFSAQDYGPDALVLPWSVENLNDGAYFFYSVGLMNEAHRWAYEDMVTFGYRPQNLKTLARTSLVSGDYGMMKKYTNILRKTIYYRKWAEDLEEMADDPARIGSVPELAAKVEILPRSDFFVEYTDPPNNLILLLEGQPENRKALEYLLAGLLLAKNLEGAVSNLPELREAGYARIPRHLEEAALLAPSSVLEALDLGELEINPETRARFEQYARTLDLARMNPSTLFERMQEGFGDTYWFYYHFR